MNILEYLFFPFVFYPIWGIFACYFVTFIISKRIIKKYGSIRTVIISTLILLIFFTPFVVLADGSNIPVIFPLIAIYLGYILDPLLSSPLGKVSVFTFTYLFIPIALLISVFIAYRIERRKHK